MDLDTTVRNVCNLLVDLKFEDDMAYYLNECIGRDQMLHILNNVHNHLMELQTLKLAERIRTSEMEEMKSC